MRRLSRAVLAAVLAAVALAAPARATVAGIGGNTNGELGAGYRGTSVPYPVQSVLYDNLGAAGIDSAYHSSYALLATGQVADAGGNDYGQLANGNRKMTLFPYLLPYLTEAVELDASGGHAMVRLADGQVLSWGTDFAGVCGCGVPGGETGVHVPTAVSLPAPATRIFDRGTDAGAVLANGEIYVWGENNTSQLARAPSKEYDTPVRLAVPGPVREVAFGGLPSIGGHIYVVLQDGSVWGAGGDAGGQLCIGPSETPYSSLVKLPLQHIRQVSADITHALFLAEDGTVFACGRNDYGQIGDGTTAGKVRPTKVLTGAQQVAAGFRWSFAVAGEALYGWGRNESHQLGNGSTANQLTPAPTGLTRVSYVQADEYSSFAITAAPVAQPPFEATVAGKAATALWRTKGTAAWYLMWRLAGSATNPWLGEKQLAATATTATTPPLQPGRYELWLRGGGVPGGFLTEVAVG